MSATLIGIGRLGREPKMQYTDAGLAITHLNVAIGSGFGDKKVTTWFDVSSFGKQAEILNERLSKGDRVKLVMEFVEVKTYEKKDGSTGVEVRAKLLDFEFVDSVKSSDGAEEPEEF